MSVFGLPVTTTAPLQQFCDDQFNTPMQQPGRFKVLAPLVTLTFARIAGVSSGVPGFTDKGTLSENEATFWVPVIDTAPAAAGPALLVAVPYMLVDNVLALAAGREIFGFPKDPAVVTIPANPETDVFAVDAETVPAFGNGAPLAPVRLIEIAPAAAPGVAGSTTVVDARTALTEVVAIIESLARNLAHPSLDLRLVVQMLSELRHPGLVTILLKQMRDITDGLKACYQAVVLSSLQVSKFSSFNRLGAHVITLKSTDSHPLIASLGFGAAELPEVSVPALFAFSLQFDSVLPNGQVLWDSAGAPLLER